MASAHSVSEFIDKISERWLVVAAVHLAGVDDDRLHEEIHETLQNLDGQTEQGPRIEAHEYGFWMPLHRGFADERDEREWQHWWREHLGISDDALAIITAAADQDMTAISFDQDAWEIDPEILEKMKAEYLAPHTPKAKATDELSP